MKQPVDVNNNQKGYILLITVLVIGAIGVAIAVSVIWLGLGGSKSSFALEQGSQAKALTNACAEEALEIISEQTSFSGTGSLTLGQGSCSYTVTKLTGQDRTITALGTVGSITRKSSLSVSTINPTVVTSWQEVADF